MDLSALVEKLGVLSKNLASTTSIRERVRIADRIFDVLGDIERQVEGFVVNELGQAKQSVEARPNTAQPSKDRFRRLTITEAGKVLLKEHGQLHGKEIERLLKEGGLRSKAENFQSTMIVAFNRDGGFHNIGGNTWRLKDAVLPFPQAANGAHKAQSLGPTVPSSGAPVPEALRR